MKSSAILSLLSLDQKDSGALAGTGHAPELFGSLLPSSMVVSSSRKVTGSSTRGAKPKPSWDLHFGCVANWPGNPVRNLRRWLSSRCVNSEGTQFNITGTARAIPQSPHASAPSTCLDNKQPQFRGLHLPGQPQYRQCYKTDPSQVFAQSLSEFQEGQQQVDSDL